MSLQSLSSSSSSPKWRQQQLQQLPHVERPQGGQERQPLLLQQQNRPARRVPSWREAVAGACAGALSRSVMAPVERVKLLLQLQGWIRHGGTGNNSTATTARRRLNAWQVAVTVYREEGWRAFWRGNWPNVLRVSGTAALNFTCMDYYKHIVLHFMRIAETHQTNQTTQNVPDSTIRPHWNNDQQERRRKRWVSFVSGGLAGATSTTLLYPLEFVRTRLAVDMGSDGAKLKIAASATSTTGTRQYRGMVHVASTIARLDGVMGFYQGYGVALLGGIVYRILYLGGYDVLKRDIVYYKQSSNPQNASSSLSWSERLVAAQTISVTAGIISYPFDSIRRRLMMQAGVPITERIYRNAGHCAVTMWQTEGWKGFYLGVGPNLVRSVGGALLLVAYDSIKSMLA